MNPAPGSATAAAHGAVTVLNATATGRGCSLAVQGGVEADWTWTDGDHLVWGVPGMDNRLASAVHRLLVRQGAPAGARATTRSSTPPARGLKTSSSAAAALVTAALRAWGQDPEPVQVIRLAVEASIAAQVTLTGALDDQAATVLGGCHLTDNAAGRILHSFLTPDWHVAVWVPDQGIPKKRVAVVDATAIAGDIHAAEARLLDGDLPGALIQNGAAFTRLYQAAGLPIPDGPTEAALEAGALGAGLSGTGPAVAALFDDPVDLSVVSGGTWHWTRTVPEGP